MNYKCIWPLPSCHSRHTFLDFDSTLMVVDTHIPSFVTFGSLIDTHNLSTPRSKSFIEIIEVIIITLMFIETRNAALHGKENAFSVRMDQTPN